MSVQSRAGYSPPPDPPERPEGVAPSDPSPRWPWWFGPVAMLAGGSAAVIVSVLMGLVLGAAGAVDPEDPTSMPLVTIVGTVVFDAIFVAAAVLFAAIKRRPRAWHFGLRRTRFWPAVGLAALGMASFYAFAAVYSLLVPVDAEQTVTQDLGLRQGGLLLVLGGILVVAVAPVAEELFFRGFFYKALRTNLSILPAALIDGALFGLIHFTGPDSVLILPVLAILGFAFCLVYERTGSLYPVIALHALNNAIALGVQTGTGEAWLVAVSVGAVTVAACALAPRFIGRPAPAMR